MPRGGIAAGLSARCGVRFVVGSVRGSFPWLEYWLEERYRAPQAEQRLHQALNRRWSMVESPFCWKHPASPQVVEVRAVLGGWEGLRSMLRPRRRWLGWGLVMLWPQHHREWSDWGRRVGRSGDLPRRGRGLWRPSWVLLVGLGLARSLRRGCVALPRGNGRARRQ